MRRLPLVVGPLMLVAVLAAPAWAEQTLRSTPSCQGLTVAGSQFPDRVVLVMVRDVRNGQVLAGPVPANTRGDGSFQAALRLDLRTRRMVEVTAWKKSGPTVIMTARQLVSRPCAEDTATVSAASAVPAGGVLPATGAHPAALTVGLLLIAGGIGLRGAMRYQGRHAAPPVWLARLLDLWPSSTSQPGGDRPPQLGRHDPVPSQQQRAG
ncbi:MAG TPA: hypothetical protein VNK73_09150 [Actinomycetota bacterium]|nr:hypothetical protein [Actinomycetota bacterium]